MSRNVTVPGYAEHRRHHHERDAELNEISQLFITSAIHAGISKSEADQLRDLIAAWLENEATDEAWDAEKADARLGEHLIKNGWRRG